MILLMVLMMEKDLLVIWMLEIILLRRDSTPGDRDWFEVQSGGATYQIDGFGFAGIVWYAAPLPKGHS